MNTQQSPPANTGKRQQPSKKITALVLQGGGALGAFEYGVVKALYENSDFHPDIVCGVSIGGFSAAVIGGAKDGPVAGLEQLWQLFTAENMPFIPHAMQVFLTMPCNPGMYIPNYSGLVRPLSTTHFFDTRPLYRTLHQVIDFDRLNSPEAPTVVVTATNLVKGVAEPFSNREMPLTDRHIVASGSLPPSFPMVEIDGSYYWDGGLFSNTPLKPAVRALEQLAECGDDTEIIMVELFPKTGAVPHNMADVIERMSSLLFENKITFDQKLFDRTTSNIEFVQALDAELPQDSPLRQAPAFKQLMGCGKIDQLTVIRYTGEETMLGVSDFTEKTIRHRIELGYHEGLAHLAAR